MSGGCCEGMQLSLELYNSEMHHTHVSCLMFGMCLLVCSLSILAALNCPQALKPGACSPHEESINILHCVLHDFQQRVDLT